MKNHWYFFLILPLFQSCVPQHKMVYAQSPVDGLAYAYSSANKKALLIEPADVLYISVGTAGGDPNLPTVFNQEKQNYNSISEISLSVLGYTVNDSGSVSLPVIGKICVQGLTVDQAAAVIRDSTKHIIINPIVSVRFVNNSVTILGEVTKAGSYPYPSEKLTVFNALGLAGDITEYGNRKQVMLIREGGQSIHKYCLDLTQDSIFRNEFYYLRPNDVLYIAPLKIRRFGMKEYPFNLIVSAVTSALLVLYYEKK